MARLDLILAAVESATQRWPSLQINPLALDAHLGGLGVDDRDILKYGDDLVLAFACASGQPAALSELESELCRHGAITRQRFHIDEDGLADLLQIVRAKLLLGPAPRIASYSAKGPFGAWLRMIVVRAALDRLQGCRFSGGGVRLEDIASDALAIDVRTEGGRQVPRLGESLEIALRGLVAEDRLLLKLHYLEGVSLDRLAVLMQVHRTTVARRIAGLRKQILGDMKERLGVLYRTSPSEFKSILRTFGPQVEITLSRLLAS